MIAVSHGVGTEPESSNMGGEGGGGGGDSTIYNIMYNTCIYILYM